MKCHICGVECSERKPFLVQKSYAYLTGRILNHHQEYVRGQSCLKCNSKIGNTPLIEIAIGSVMIAVSIGLFCINPIAAIIMTAATYAFSFVFKKIFNLDGSRMAFAKLIEPPNMPGAKWELSILQDDGTKDYETLKELD